MTTNGAGMTSGDSTVRSAADPALVGAWLAARLRDPRWSRCRIARVGTGRSNLTFRVDSEAGSVVLRRPPQGEVAVTAHDMEREQRVLTALAGTDVPVPAVLGGAGDDGPLDAPFYVMELVDGVIAVHELPEGWAPSAAQRRDLAHSLIDVLARLHAVDPSEVGLGDFGRPEGFMARQLRRWNGQWETWREGQDRPGLTALGTALREQLPESGPGAIVHGDYRIDNVVFDRADPGRVLAVLDWEMATLGDPLADLGLMMVTWQQPHDSPEWLAARVLPTPTGAAGFPSRAEMAARYAEISGRRVEQLPWYVAFGCFKMAVVLAGIVSRVRSGAMPADTATGMAEAIEPLTRLGDHVLRTGRY